MEIFCRVLRYNSLQFLMEGCLFPVLSFLSSPDHLTVNNQRVELENANNLTWDLYNIVFECLFVSGHQMKRSSWRLVASFFFSFFCDR